MNLGLTLSTVLAAAAISQSAAAESFEFEYRLKNYPSTAPACHAIAQGIGEHLAQTFGVTLVRARCELTDSPTHSGIDLSIVYASEHELQLTSTYDDMSFGDQGSLATREACESTLDTEAEHFTRATGLDVFLSICQRDPSPYSQAPWFARIDGFGPTNMLHRTRDAILFGSPIGFTSEGFAAYIKKILLDAGYDVRTAFLDGYSSTRHLRIALYTTDRVHFNVDRVNLVDRKSECEAELTHLTAALGVDTPALASFCVQAIPGGFEASTFYAGDLPYTFEFAVEEYDTYATCAAARPELLAFYRGLSRDVVGGLCSRVFNNSGSLSSKWSVRLIEPN